ncbi:MAG: Tryptophan 2,3-dioxygenase [Candidatus Heimdallarchaeota archaeon LC_3]|nr:MAG: Tryptophan 2,3-dioxygenase [Candidatus Heimdallarchaeota archaeon LC_3]
MSKKDLTYWDYLKLDTILNLQTGFNKEEGFINTDELHFIIVHQTLELWFKLFIRDMKDIVDILNVELVPETSIPLIVEKLKRSSQIVRLATNHFDVLETLLPQNFLEFRNKLGTASGFQSVQMREMEILMGLDDKQRFSLGGSNAIEHIKSAAILSEAGKRAWERIEKIKKDTNLKVVLNEWLYRTPINGSSPELTSDVKVVEDFIESYLQGYELLLQEQKQKLQETGITDVQSLNNRMKLSLNQVKEFLEAADIPESEKYKQKRIRAGILFIESYRNLPLLAWPRLLLDSIVELEEQFILFRTRHARMVERMIGRRIGTGGSSGVDYLDATTKYRIFTDLWAVRTAILPKYCLPELNNKEFYDFAT